MSLARLPAEILHEVLVYAVPEQQCEEVAPRCYGGTPTTTRGYQRSQVSSFVRLRLVNKTFSHAVEYAMFAADFLVPQWRVGLEENRFWRSFIIYKAQRDSTLDTTAPASLNFRAMLDFMCDHTGDDSDEVKSEYSHVIASIMLKPEALWTGNLAYLRYVGESPPSHTPEPSNISTWHLIVAAWMGWKSVLEQHLDMKRIEPHSDLNDSHLVDDFQYVAYAAAYQGHTEIVRMITAIDPSLLRHALFGASSGGQLATFTYIVQQLSPTSPIMEYWHYHRRENWPHRQLLMASCPSIPILKLLLETNILMPEMASTTPEILCLSDMCQVLENAVLANNPVTLQFLLTHPDMPIPPYSQVLHTALSVACAKGFNECAKILLDHKAPIYFRPNIATNGLRGLSALNVAVSRGVLTTTKLLLEHIKRPSSRYLSRDIAADASRNPRLAKLLTDHGFSAV